MALTRVLITVATYPLPSRSHDELVCTAGITENGEWIRIYPVPLSFLLDLRGSGQFQKIKYQWIELNLEKRKDDFRPESHSPLHYDFKDINVGESLDTKQNWYERKSYCLRNVYTNLDKLIQDSKEPKSISLATFKPSSILGIEIEKDDRDWKDEWKELRKQGDLFAKTDKPPETMIPKLPYKFRYRFTDDEGKESRLMIEDWEIGALYWNCLRRAEGDESVALDKVKEKYESFIKNNDVHFFLGTTLQWHKRARNPFLIIGVFYPKKDDRLSLF